MPKVKDLLAMTCVGKDIYFVSVLSIEKLPEATASFLSLPGYKLIWSGEYAERQREKSFSPL